ncbi:hypothetical protein Thiowin_04100 [Thiorhodovibrio winogradskyi]|uniref:Uncharacterized protein n=1 Tax=Thiorhodovibrio winogradskyi TaxID=77007 RepID=A0ABZ0SD82_9GAMM|nr:hypothetical protein [Thiorhodovibrio winogradskyi]
MSRDPRIPWHELLGKALTDALIGLPYSVSTEEELALRSQRLDVLIIEQAPAAGSDGSDPRRRVAGGHLERTNAPHQARNVLPAPEFHPNDLERPDGLEDLAAHNLLSFKAAGAPYDAWALEELNSHYVTYRKLASIRALPHQPARLPQRPIRDEHPVSDTDQRSPQSPAGDARDQQPVSEPDTAYRLLPAADFRSYAVATHFPRKLIKQLPPGSCQRGQQPGLYTLRAGTREVRLIVINDLRDLPHNAPWRLFCSNKAQQRAALQQYHPHSEIGLHLYSLLAHHLLGDGTMAHTFEDMQREAHEWLKDSIRKLDPDEVLQCYAPEERLKGLEPEDRLKGLDPEERLKGLDAEDVFSRFDPATIEAWLKKHRRDH